MTLKLIPSKVLVIIIKFYQLVISPLFPATCRFTPTCSEYSVQAIRKFGFFKGLYLAIRRIIRCRPGGGFGYDPVPETFSLRRDREK